MMFGLSKRETILNAIENASKNNYPTLVDAIREIDMNHLSRSEAVNEIAKAQRIYFFSVVDSIEASFRISSPKIAERLRLSMYSPSLAGLPEDEYNVDTFSKQGISGGILFLLTHYAITGKKVSQKDEKYFNLIEKYQSDLLSAAFLEFNITLPEE